MAGWVPIYRGCTSLNVEDLWKVVYAIGLIEIDFKILLSSVSMLMLESKIHMGSKVDLMCSWNNQILCPLSYLSLAQVGSTFFAGSFSFTAFLGWNVCVTHLP